LVEFGWRLSDEVDGIFDLVEVSGHDPFVDLISLLLVDREDLHDLVGKRESDLVDVIALMFLSVFVLLEFSHLLLHHFFLHFLEFLLHAESFLHLFHLTFVSLHEFLHFLQHRSGIVLAGDKWLLTLLIHDGENGVRSLRRMFDLQKWMWVIFGGFAFGAEIEIWEDGAFVEVTDDGTIATVTDVAFVDDWALILLLVVLVDLTVLDWTIILNNSVLALALEILIFQDFSNSLSDFGK